MRAVSGLIRDEESGVSGRSWWLRLIFSFGVGWLALGWIAPVDGETDTLPDFDGEELVVETGERLA